MNRLTEKFKDDSGYQPIEHHNCCNVTLYDFNVDDYDLCVDKLGKLEDLEEELGCPLDVVFKALIEGIHIQTEFLDLTIKDFILKPRLYFSNDFKCYCLETGYGANMIKLKDYQKTWWLKGER